MNSEYKINKKKIFTMVSINLRKLTSPIEGMIKLGVPIFLEKFSAELM